MKQFVAAAGLVALVISMPACLKHTYVVGSGAPQGEITYKHWHHHWLFGLIRPELQNELDVDKFCPSGNATVHEETSFANGLVDVLTTFIYAPTTVTIRCQEGGEAEVELDADAVARITRDPNFLRFLEEVAPERVGAARAALERPAEGGEDSSPVLAPR